MRTKLACDSSPYLLLGTQPHLHTHKMWYPIILFAFLNYLHTCKHSTTHLEQSHATQKNDFTHMQLRILISIHFFRSSLKLSHAFVCSEFQGQCKGGGQLTPLLFFNVLLTRRDQNHHDMFDMYLHSFSLDGASYGVDWVFEFDLINDILLNKHDLRGVFFDKRNQCKSSQDFY